ncbi:hypothetical protein GY45DRAFT_394492 [Cubamyces sp. BRFM 1775]|nr:hypothetical protein GY45DRAFT_394492 [Cubamyces sp. BRFM 1775]
MDHMSEYKTPRPSFSTTVPRSWSTSTMSSSASASHSVTRNQRGSSSPSGGQVTAPNLAPKGTPVGTTGTPTDPGPAPPANTPPFQMCQQPCFSSPQATSSISVQTATSSISVISVSPSTPSESSDASAVPVIIAASTSSGYAPLEDNPSTIPLGQDPSYGTASTPSTGSQLVLETTADIPSPRTSSATPTGHGTDGHRSNNHKTSGVGSATGAIVGGVIGGLALVLLVACGVIILRRRIRARHTAPSAEFMAIMRHGGVLGGAGHSGALSPVKRGGGSTTPGHGYYSDVAGMGERQMLSPVRRQSSLESDERPPAFTPGLYYKDPVLEKVHAAAEMREEYFRFRREPTVATAAAAGVGVEPEVGPTMGTDGCESGHGHGYTIDPEKADYAWAI